jgi:tetratricopeptide (TPR) repeat protein
VSDGDDALLYFDRAIQMDDRNPHPFYRKSLALHELHRTTDVLKCLKKVLDLAPDEFMVHLKIGAINLEIGNKREALKWLFNAIDLDSSRVGMVKELIDRCAINDFYQS